MIILGTNSIKDTGYDVANSCRFNRPDNPVLRKTNGTPSDNNKYTYSCWVKRAGLGTIQGLIGSLTDENNRGQLEFNSSNQLNYYENLSGSTSAQVTTTQVFRDVGAWLNILLQVDLDQATASNRIKMYVNGTQITSFGTATYPSQGAVSVIANCTATLGLLVGGSTSNASTWYNLDGYIAEAVYLDGQAPAPTSFGEFDDSGIWKPIDVSGLTFGNNGFYLDFEDSANLGNDANGGTDLTEVNITATDQSTDTCTNNFATLNPLNPIVHTFEEGNLRIDGASSNWDSAFSTIGASSGKWYFEMKFLALEGGLRRAAMGLVDARGQTQFATNEVGYTVTNATGDSVGYNGNGTSNTIKKNDTGQYNGTEWNVNDIICMAVDLDNSAVYFRVNGSAWLNSGNPESGASKTGAVTITAGETYVFGGTAYGSSTEWEFNFGSPSYSESGGNSDGDGYGNFNQAVPSGYFSLNTKNLAEYG